MTVASDDMDASTARVAFFLQDVGQEGVQRAVPSDELPASIVVGRSSGDLLSGEPSSNMLIENGGDSFSASQNEAADPRLALDAPQPAQQRSAIQQRRGSTSNPRSAVTLNPAGSLVPARRASTDMGPRGNGAGTRRASTDVGGRESGAGGRRASNDFGGRESGAGRDDDKNSFVSTTATGAKMQDKVRRVIEFGTGSLLPSLRLLRWSALFLAALSIALSVVMSNVRSDLVTHSSTRYCLSLDLSLQLVTNALTIYNGALVDVQNSCYNVAYMKQMVRNSRALFICNSGWWPCDDEAFRYGITSNAQAWNLGHRSIIRDARIASLTLYDTPTVLELTYWTDPITGELQNSSTYNSLLIAGLHFYDEAIAVALTPLENITATLPALRVWQSYLSLALCCYK